MLVETGAVEPDEKGNLVEIGAVLRPETQLQGNCRVGAYTQLNGATVYPCTVIGRYCSVARGAALGAPDHPMHCLGTSLFLSGTMAALRFDPAHIGSDVWIGANAIVLAGVKVGDGAVIGAGSIVTKDVEPFSIIVGNPGRHLRYRFPPEIRAALIELRWWDRDHATIVRLPHGDIDRCIEMLRS